MTRILLLTATAISLIIPVATADAASRHKSKHYRSYHGSWQAPGYYGPGYYGGPRYLWRLERAGLYADTGPALGDAQRMLHGRGLWALTRPCDRGGRGR